MAFRSCVRTLFKRLFSKSTDWLIGSLEHTVRVKELWFGCGDIAATSRPSFYQVTETVRQRINQQRTTAWNQCNRLSIVAVLSLRTSTDVSLTRSFTHSPYVRLHGRVHFTHRRVADESVVIDLPTSDAISLILFFLYTYSVRLP